MKTEIPFNQWSQSRINAGMKECTSRHSKYPNDKRVTWISPKLPFWFIKKYLWQPEGATSPEELQKVVNDIYNREVPEDETFYVHFGDFKPLASELPSDVENPKIDGLGKTQFGSHI